MQGGGSRIQKILSSIKNAAPTIVIFSEFHNSESGNTIRHNMLRLGYLHQVVGPINGSINTVAIFSKLPCNTAQFPNCDENFPHALVKAEFDLFNVYGVYFPHKKKHKLFEFLTNEELDDAKPSIVAGDFNTGKNYIDQKGNSFWYTDQLLTFEEKGYVDAFRLKYGETKEFSWYSHQGNGFRYDHTYISESLAPIVSDCYYLHKLREEKQSDHSPMVLELA